MNKRQLEVEKAKLKSEKQELDHLRAIYNKALEDVQSKLKITNGKIDVLLKNLDNLNDADKSILQSQIYQKKFQENIKNQLDAFYKELTSEQHKSMQSYLRSCYDMGFVGSIYDIHGQGIPIIAQISQKNVIRAMNINSKISTSLYNKLGVDVELLKKRIANNVSRGIATSSTFSVIARNIAADSNVGFNRAMRIARTEGHRILCESAFDAQHAAKDAGADILKQWDSTLDGNTRETHTMLDGQIRELDEPFEVLGMEAPYPSGFGIAGEDINCRCALLQRAKWALDEEELEVLKKRAEYFKLDKTKDFGDFKKKYLKVNEKTVTTSKKISTFAHVKTIEEAVMKINKGMGAKIGGKGLIPVHEEPIVVKKIDYNDKTTVIIELRNFEKSAITESVETACVITADGEVYKCFGVEDRVFPDYDLGDNLKGASITHNHPIEETTFSFSRDDLQLFMEYDIVVMRGCDENYTYELNRNPMDIDDMPIDWMNFENFNHTNIIRLAKEYGIGYRRWKNEQSGSR